MSDTDTIAKLPKSQSTIGDALGWFERSDGVVQSSALREVISLMIQSNLRTDFENDSYLDALILTEVMFNRSHKSIQLFTGPGCADFLKALQKAFVTALDRLKCNAGQARIILISDKKPDFLIELENRYKGTLQIALAAMKENVRVGHFFVCDLKMARVEEPHEPLTNATLINAVKAQVHFNNTTVSNMLSTQFDAFWNVVMPKPKSA